ncbi:hypothetical protein MVEN_01127600 [Mycena venus]|uniref:Oxidase ustYa n=1 Tax=Mycena venus TaxID=2733690 RepID=A0A8H7D0P2_9AGAR|nr:hypothetical protein MVEN_01127600 [Mycena venus]
MRLPTPSSLDIALTGLLVSISFNLSAIYVFRGQLHTCARRGIVDDSRFSYIGDDHPNQLPLHVPMVALKLEDSERYSLSQSNAYSDWRSTDVFPHGNGFVKLGPEGRSFGVAMFHQMHCLQIIRSAIVQGGPDHHARHCLNLLRQTVLCASDTTLDALTSNRGTDGVGTVHVCRDWQTVYDFVEQNQLKHMNLTR